MGFCIPDILHQEMGTESEGGREREGEKGRKMLKYKTGKNQEGNNIGSQSMGEREIVSFPPILERREREWREKRERKKGEKGERGRESGGERERMGENGSEGENGREEEEKISFCLTRIWERDTIVAV